MIYEFAVDPSSLIDWTVSKHILAGFGVPHGRLISRFPRKWYSLAWEAFKSANESGTTRLKMGERLKVIKDKALIPSGRDYDPSRSWLQNAMDVHQSLPFRAIITTEVCNNASCVLSIDDLDDQTGLWNVPRELEIARTAEAMGDAIELFLRTSDHIVFVDKYFDPGEQKKGYGGVRKGQQWINTLCAFIDRALWGRDHIPEFEYHTSIFEKEFSADVEKRNKQLEEYYESWLAKEIPLGVEILVLIWSEDYSKKNLHARYVLSERGGVNIDAGLDHMSEEHKTDVRLLDTSAYNKRWSTFCEASELWRKDRDRFREESEHKGWVHAIEIKGEAKGAR